VIQKYIYTELFLNINFVPKKFNRVIVGKSLLLMKLNLPCSFKSPVEPMIISVGSSVLAMRFFSAGKQIAG